MIIKSKNHSQSFTDQTNSLFSKKKKKSLNLYIYIDDRKLKEDIYFSAVKTLSWHLF